MPDDQKPTPQPSPSPPPDARTPEPDSDDAYIASLPERARRLVERANHEAGGRRQELREAHAELERLRREHESEQQRVVREAEERGRAATQSEHDQVVTALRREIATMGIRARAADRFADPDDAVRLLALDELLSEADETRRNEAVTVALDALLKAKPYLGRDRPQPLVTPGPRSTQLDGRPRERSWLRQ